MSDKSRPSVNRSRLWQRVNAAAAEGVFKLQICGACHKVQYPPREFCSGCLSDALTWEPVSAGGAVLSWTRSHSSVSRFFKDKLPLHVGAIKLDCGPVLFAHLSANSLQTGARVQIMGRPDKSGQTVFFARPADTGATDEFSMIMKE